MEKIVYIRRLSHTYKVVKISEDIIESYRIAYKGTVASGYVVAYWTPCDHRSLFIDLARDSIGFNNPPHTRVLEGPILLQNMVFQTRDGQCYRDITAAVNAAGSVNDVSPLAIYSNLEELPDGQITSDTYTPLLFRVGGVYFRCPDLAEKFSREGHRRLVVERVPVVSRHVPFGNPVSRDHFFDPFSDTDLNAV